MPDAQLIPQAPQFWLSFVKLAQRPLHSVRPAWHETAHMPAEQTSPVGHVFPQIPQLALSSRTFVQVPPQLVRPAWHVTAQAPPEQS
jgi:hypothetical protein